MVWSFSLPLKDLKMPIMQTGVFSPQMASKFVAVNKGTTSLSLSESACVFLLWVEIIFLFFFSKPSSKELRSLIVDFISFTWMPIFRICFSPFDSQPTTAGSSSTLSFFTAGSEISRTYKNIICWQGVNIKWLSYAINHFEPILLKIKLIWNYLSKTISLKLRLKKGVNK